MSAGYWDRILTSLCNVAKQAPGVEIIMHTTWGKITAISKHLPTRCAKH